MSDDDKVNALLEELAVVESALSPLRATLRKSVFAWIIGAVLIVILASGGGLGYALSWVAGLTAILGLGSLPRVKKLRALEERRNRLMVGVGETIAAEDDPPVDRALDQP